MEFHLLQWQWPAWIHQISFSKTELVAALLSFWCVWLAAKNSLLNWPVAMVGSCLYVVVFFQGALYSDAFLNVIFLLFQAYGWYQWTRKPKHSNEHSQQPHRAAMRDILKVLLVGLVFYYPWTLFVKGGSVQQWISPEACPPPRFLYLDAALFILSISALYMQSKRWIQHWFVWILVDVVYVPVYLLNNNVITAILYFIYIPLAVKGYQLWRLNLRERTTAD